MCVLLRKTVHLMVIISMFVYEPCSLFIDGQKVERTKAIIILYPKSGGYVPLRVALLDMFSRTV